MGPLYGIALIVVSSCFAERHPEGRFWRDAAGGYVRQSADVQASFIAASTAGASPSSRLEHQHSSSSTYQSVTLSRIQTVRIWSECFS